MNVRKTSVVLAAALAVTVGSSVALAGPTLTALPHVTNLQSSTVKTSTFPTSITPDGAYVGGTAGLGFGSVGDDTGFVYDVGLGTSHHVIAGGYQDSVTGIGYRYPTGGGLREIVIGGNNGGIQSSMNANTGVPPVNNWQKRRRSSGGLRDSVYNTVNGGSVGQDLIHSTYKTRGSSTPQLYVDAWSGGSPGAFAPNSPDTKGTTMPSNIRGVSNAGVAVGDRVNGGVVQSYILTYGGGGGLGAAFATGLDGLTNCELWDIADSGIYAGGRSAKTGKSGLWAYVRQMSDGSVYELPTANPSADPAGASIVYGMSPDGNWAVGTDATSGVEKAVLWDISDATPANWTVLDLTDWATGLGILDGFTGNLRRAIAMGVNGQGEPVITGVGYNPTSDAAGWTGFVLTVPEPATALFLALGGVVLLRRRH